MFKRNGQYKNKKTKNFPLLFKPSQVITKTEKIISNILSLKLDIKKKNNLVITKNFQSLGRFILINYEEIIIDKKVCINLIFETDVREAKSYKCYNGKVYKYIIGIKPNEAKKFLSSTKYLLETESKLMKYIGKMKNEDQVIRPSGKYLEKTNVNNGAVVIIGNRTKILKLRKKFEPTDNENFIGIINIPFDSNFLNNPELTLYNNLINDSEYFKLNINIDKIKLKHHLSFFLKKINVIYSKIEKSTEFSIPYILLLIKKCKNRFDIDIPGGKRELGETSWQAAEREAKEETGINDLFNKSLEYSEKIIISKMDIFLHLLF
jgi:hypothetical protein